MSLSFSIFHIGSLHGDARGLVPQIKALDAEGRIGRQWLVLIGINHYFEWTPLAGPVRDAKDIRDILLRRYHIDQVVELYNEDATKSGIIALFKMLTKEVKAHDSIIIF